MNREHYFSVAIAKNVFEHPYYGIVFVRDAISLADASNHKLTPVIIYVLSVVGTSIHWLAFASAKNPRSFCNVLQEAWKKAEGLRGAPDVLKINKHIANACPYLPAILEGIGIRVELVDGSDKRLPAALRTAQGLVTDLSYAFGGVTDKKITSISKLNETAILQHNNFDIRYRTNMHRSLAEANNQFISLPAKPYHYLLPENDTWVQGGWLSAWDINLPPVSTYFFYKSDEGNMWLIKGDRDDTSIEVGGEGIKYQPDSLAANLTKTVLGCWPNKISEVAKSIGITARELNWYTSGRTDLDVSKKTALLTMLGIEINNNYDEYELTGGCVLMASNQRSTIATYEEISHGGDLEYSFELIPKNGKADPSYRYVLFSSCGGLPTVLMVPRGNEASAILDVERLINYEGLKEVEISFYFDIVSMCARACVGVPNNRLEVMQFVIKNEKSLLSFLNTSPRIPIPK
jgi:hypothetical protein